MMQLKRLSALILVLAMVFTMAPVFAAAEHAGVPAVEDVPVASGETTDAAPAIETAAPESVPVTAELQAGVAYADDAAAIEAGYFLRTTAPGGTVLYHNGLKDAFTVANGWSTAGGKIELISDWDLVNPAITTPLTKTYTDTSEPGIPVQGVWFDLCGHTLIISHGGNGADQYPFKCTIGNNKLNFKNGKIIDRNRGAYGAYRGGLISLGCASTDSPASSGTAYQQTVTFKDMEIITLRYDETTGAAKANYVNPIVFIGQWNATINVYDSTLLSEDGPGIFFKKNVYATASNYVDVNYTVNIYGNSIVGAPCKDTGRSDVAAIRATVANSSTNGASGAHNLTVNVSPDAVLVGQKSVYNASLFNVRINKIGSDGALMPTTFDETTFAYDLPDRDSVPTTALGRVTEENQPITYVGMVEDFSAFRAHKHSPEHRDAVAPTTTETGLAEHWYCPICGAYLTDAAGEHETTLETLTIPVTCQHTGAEHHDPVPATYAATGVAECWYCPDCSTYFADAECTTETTLEALATPIISDANGKTDEQLVAMGAVVKAVAPDGTQTAYLKPSDGYKTAASWTTAGGKLYLLCDYTIVNSTASTSTPIVNNGAASKDTNKSYTYVNDEDPSLKGFWFDLGGHTLTARTGQPLFYANASLPFNICNGNVFLQNVAQINPTYGILKCGYTSSTPGSSTEIYHPVWTLKNVNMIRLPYAGSGAAGPAVYVSTYQSTLNLIDSTLVSAEYFAVYYYKAAPSSPSSALTSLAAQSDYAHTINISGKSVFGVAANDRNMIFVNNVKNGLAVASHSITVNAAGNDVVFLGGGWASNSYDACKLTLPRGYYESTYAVAMPDEASLAEETSAVAPGWKEPVEVHAYCSAAGKTDSSLAAFTPDGGAAGDQVTLKEAVQAWMDAGYRGTITLQSDVDEDSALVTQAFVGEKFTYYTTSSSTTYSRDAAIYLGAAANGGALTLDLNGHTISSSMPVLATAPELSGFELKIVNGCLAGSGGMILFLDGAGVGLVMENVAMTASNGAYCVYELRKSGSYSILRSCSFASEDRPNFYMITHSAYLSDASLVYYTKDCAFSAPASGYRPIYHCTAAGSHRNYTWIFDGNNTFVSGYTMSSSPYFRGANASFEGNYYDLGGAVVPPTETQIPYTFTTDTASSLLSTGSGVATVSFADVSLHFKTLSDALTCAGRVGRSEKLNPTVTLNGDAALTKSAAAGQSGYRTRFTLELNGKRLADDAGLIAPVSGKNTSVTLKVTGSFGEGAAKIKPFAGAPAVNYASGDEYVLGRNLLSTYSLNLEENVKINLYADVTPDAVYYVQDGAEHAIAAPDAAGAWIVDTLAAKDMCSGVDVYALKDDGSTHYVDFIGDVSVLQYVLSDPASALNASQTELIAALKATLGTMMLYGKYAEKYFRGDYTAVKPDEIEQIGLVALPKTDVSNLTDAPCVVSGMADLRSDPDAGTGFGGTSAVLEDSVLLKFYFKGSAFDGASATVNGTPAAVEKSGAYRFVQCAVPARARTSAEAER